MTGRPRQLARSWQSRTFSALKYPAYRLYWVSQLISLIGSWMQTTAQAYLVLEVTGNNSAALGWVSAFQFTPSLLLSLFAGAVIDRVPRRRVLLVTQVVLLLSALGLAITTQLGVINLPLLLGFAFLSGTANAFDMPARQSMVADFVPRSDVANAVALNSLSFNVSRTLGQAVFGLVAALGVALLAGGDEGNIARLAFPFYLNAASFIIVIAVIARLPFPAREFGDSRPVVQDIAEGLRFVRTHAGVLYTMLLIGLLSLTIINFNVIIPYFARVVFGLREAGFGWLNAAFGLGAMLGALRQASKPNPLLGLRLGSVLLVVFTAALAVVPTAWLAGVVLAGCGFAMLTLLVSANSSVQLSIPDQLRGRVMSVYSFVLVGMGPPGALLVSRLIDARLGLGPREGLGVITVLGLVVLLALWRKLPKALPKKV